MRRLLAAAAVAAVATLSAPAHAAYTCTDASASLDACVQVTECMDVCFIKPGVQFQCYLGFSGERFCRIVRALGVEVAG